MTGLSREKMARAADQPYNVILAGSFGVGKSSLFQKLSGEVNADYQFTTVAAGKAANFGKWTHTALVKGETVKVSSSKVYLKIRSWEVLIL